MSEENNYEFVGKDLQGGSSQYSYRKIELNYDKIQSGQPVAPQK